MPSPRHCCAAIIALTLSTITFAGSTPAERNEVWQNAPDSPLVQPAIDLYEAIVTRDKDAYINFLDTACHPDLHAEYERELLENYLDHMARGSEDWQLYEVRTYEAPRSAIVWRNTRTLEWQGLLVTFDSMTDARPKDFDIVPARPPASIIHTPLTESEMLAELDSAVRRLTEQGDFSGVVAVAKDGDLKYKFITGEASRAYHVPNNFNTRFCLGSMTKMFTAIAICRLADEGKLNLTDPISDYLSEDWIDPELGKQVTIEHLLTHTGGVGNFFQHPDYFDTPRAHFREVDTFAKFCKPEHLDFQPGTEYRYSNSGFVMLGKIIESASGEDYYDHMQNALYKPLGLTSTGCIDQDEINENIAQGYFFSERSGKWTNNIYTQRARGCPAGSSYSSAPDLLAFAQLLRNGKVVPPDTLKKMTTPKPNLGAHHYGYGFGVIHDRDTANSFGHNGGAPGLFACLTMFNNGYDVVILCNTGRPGQPLEAFAEELMQRLNPSTTTN